MSCSRQEPNLPCEAHPRHRLNIHLRCVDIRRRYSVFLRPSSTVWRHPRNLVPCSCWQAQAATLTDVHDPHPPQAARRTRGLTLRSRRGPTAGHQARSGGTRYIFASPGLASYRWSRLSSNVRQHNLTAQTCVHTVRPSGLTFAHASANPECSVPPFHKVSGNSAVPKPRRRASASPRERGPTVTAACHHLVPPPRLARERAKVAPAALGLHPHHRGALPNPSLKRSANGRPPGPVWRYAVHFRQPGPGVLP